eukprot:626531-Prymnesium_polylepis.1
MNSRRPDCRARAPGRLMNSQQHSKQEKTTKKRRREDALTTNKASVGQMPRHTGYPVAAWRAPTQQRGRCTHPYPPLEQR